MMFLGFEIPEGVDTVAELSGSEVQDMSNSRMWFQSVNVSSPDYNNLRSNNNSYGVLPDDICFLLEDITKVITSNISRGSVVNSYINLVTGVSILERKDGSLQIYTNSEKAADDLIDKLSEYISVQDYTIKIIVLKSGGVKLVALSSNSKKEKLNFVSTFSASYMAATGEIYF